ncbi:ATP-binding protein [Vibrio sp. HN007]|uniref:PDC sensor domain-containing protein n=1 Tax=Vibrio iocasae TaxID=3098914 RepID=UPI0035D4F74F
MGIKKRVTLFVSIFGVCVGASSIGFNQITLKNSLLSIQEQQVEASVKLGQSKINSLFREMELASKKLALYGSELYQTKDKYSKAEAENVIQAHLTDIFILNDQSIGGGIWFEPYLFDESQKRYGPYIYKEADQLIFTWDLSTPEYNYHEHSWYKIAFDNDKLHDHTSYWSEPYFDDAGTDELMVTVTTPILDSEGVKVGVATVDWAIKQLTDTVESIEFTDNSSSLLVSKMRQQFLSFPDASSLHLKPVTELPWGLSLLDNANGNTISKVENVEFNQQEGTIYFLEIQHDLILGVFLPDSDYMQHINKFTSMNLLLSVFFLIVFLFGLSFTLRRLFAPLSQIIDDIQASVQVNEKSDSIRVSPIKDVGVKEFTPIIHMLNKVYEKINDYTVQIEQKNSSLIEKKKEIYELNTYLEQKVEERTQELETKAAEVIQVLDELKEAQQQMIEMEKNAALGQLVTGVAHEINTPIGVCVTATSILDEKQTTVKNDVDENKLTKPKLMDFLTEVEEVSEVLKFNLERTKQLIESFKQVSADQAVEESRVYDLHEYMELIVGSMKLSLDQEDIAINCSVPENISIHGYPGVLSQVMSNLIANSINHAFKGVENREVTITVIPTESEKISLVYTDNGCGMNEESVGRVFEPFFTTKRGQGGTGLGMHITYNLVTQKLKGSISVESKPGQGVRFNMVLPVNHAE